VVGSFVLGKGTGRRYRFYKAVCRVVLKDGLFFFYRVKCADERRQGVRPRRVDFVWGKNMPG